MSDVIKNIIVTADSIQTGSADHDSPGTDVIVQLNDDDQYIATFYSVTNLEHMIASHKQSKDYESKGYYRILNAVIVNTLHHHDLFPVIETMIMEGDFQLIFKKV